jgi:hypothetical protein
VRIGTDGTGSCKSNNHRITAMAVPLSGTIEKHKDYTVVVSEQFQNTATNQPTNEKNVERDKINIR